MILMEKCGLGKRLFMLLSSLGLIGVFCFVALANEATTGKKAQQTPAAKTQDSAQPGKIERAGQATGKAIGEAADSTEQGLKRAVKSTEQGLTRAGQATTNAFKEFGEALEKFFSGKESKKTNSQPK